MDYVRCKSSVREAGHLTEIASVWEGKVQASAWHLPPALLTISKLKCSKVHWQGLVFMECSGNQLLQVCYCQFGCWYFPLFNWRNWYFFTFDLIRSNSWDVICCAFGFWDISLKVHHISCYCAAGSARGKGENAQSRKISHWLRNYFPHQQICSHNIFC